MKDITLSADISVNGEKIDTIKVAPIKYAEFSAIWQRVSSRLQSNEKADVMLRRERIRHQVHFMGGGKRHIPDDPSILALPLATGRLIIDALDSDTGVAGKIISAADNDGISKSIIYQLGTPIPVGGKDGKAKAITELEFIASTLGDVEDVFAQDSVVTQTLSLLRTVAKPVDVASLTAMPTWAVDAVTMADGVTIGNNILPRFLG